MSEETATWLNTHTLIGFAESRGNAWHYRKEEQGAESNHYPGAIPIEDVRRRLFNWEAIEGDITTTALTPEGVLTIKDPERKAIIHNKTHKVLGVFKQGYQIHQLDEWLLNQVAFLLDDDLSIGSAGELKGGAQAWVQVEVPDSIKTPEGVEFRPHLLATTSFDGSIATTYGRSVIMTVCDNTRAVALRGMGSQQYKVRHSRYSHNKITDAREALAIVHDTGDEFAAQVAELCNVTVTDNQWEEFLQSLVPMPTEEGRGMTMAQTKQADLSQLWNHDQRVTPWKNTAFGVVQAVNTYAHHVQGVRGSRQERNMTKAITGEFDKLDSSTLKSLEAVLV